MNVKYYYRPPSYTIRSIERVFETIEKELSRRNVSVSRYVAPKFKFWPFTILVNILKCAYASRLDRGINHITGDIHYVAIFMPSSRTLLTVHDLVILHNKTLSSTFRKFVYYMWYYFPLKHLKYISCISEATRRDLVEKFPFIEDKISVIANPIAEEFFNIQPKEAMPLCPTILHLGTRENKNLERVIEALAGIECHLRIIGVLTGKQKEALKTYNIHYSNESGLTDSQILDEYNSCDIVSFPSTFEGFGMPVVEAQAASRPIVCSNIEPIVSVSGKSAILVDPFNVEDIRRGFMQAISNHSHMLDDGKRNAQLYRPAHITDQYTKLYSKIQ